MKVLSIKRYVSHKKDGFNYSDVSSKSPLGIGPSEMVLIGAIVLGIIITALSFWYFERPRGLLVEIHNQEAHVIGYGGRKDHIVIPDYYEGIPITAIKANAFEGDTHLTEVTLNNYMKHLESEVFKNSDLDTLNIVDESVLTRIGNNAFYGTPFLENIKQDSMYIVGRVIIGYDVFLEETFTIPQEILGIGDYAFKDNETIETIHVNEDLRVIGQYSFSNMKNLVSIHFPFHSEINIIEAYAFKDSTNLAEVNGPVESDVSRIGNNAFKNTIFRANEPSQYYQFGNIRVEEPIE